MSRQPVTIGHLVFSSKKAAYEHFKTILKDAKDLKALTGKQAADVEALLNNHEKAADKIGPGVLAYFVTDEEENGDRCFHVYRKDHKMVHFGYKKAVDGFTKPRSRFMAAARAAVEQDIRAFKDKYFCQHANDEGKVRVPGSEKLHARPETHVDHAPPSFREIVDNFMAIESITAENTEYANTETTGTRFEDDSLAERFREFHDRHAKLEVIAWMDNLRKAWEARSDR